MRKIKIGLAGFGMSAQVFHLPFWRADSRFEVMRVFERSGNRAQEVLPQAQTVRSFEELLSDDVDLVVITTPNQTHFDFATQALRAGKNVVVEKPLCATAAQALELAELAERQRAVDRQKTAFRRPLGRNCGCGVPFRALCGCLEQKTLEGNRRGGRGAGVRFGFAPHGYGSRYFRDA